MHRSDVTEIINACDSGREGELIFRFVYEQANCKKPFSRLWISSMEASAIREGFSNLKDGRGYDNLYQSALCRAKADWLIGINATRLFSNVKLHLYISLSVFHFRTAFRYKGLGLSQQAFSANGYSFAVLAIYSIPPPKGGICCAFL